MGESRDKLRRQVLEAAALRPLVGGETPDMVEAVALRIADLLDSLEERDRRVLLEEALRRLPAAESSLRKLEKKIRQAALATVSPARLDEAAALAPDIIIEDLHGTIRFSLPIEERVDIAGEKLVIPIVARLVGGVLERALLTKPVPEFVAEARAALNAELHEARRASDSAADAIRQILAEREHRPLYDARTLRRIVTRAIHQAEDLAGALEQIGYEVRPLDRDAAERERVRALIERHGLIAYRDYFPRARDMQRELILYAGPTNSGKTWRALNELVTGESGVYLAPLRLLALEGQEEIEKRGRSASFLTGEERDIREGAQFIASTIEMLDTQRVVDVAVIDEIQLLTDEDRGWAWCQALVGVPARRVLMTGSPDAVPLVQALADYLGEPLTVHHLERHTPIEALDRPLSLLNIVPGTAVIAFSRRDVLGIKMELEHRFGVAVIYGNLTPEVRREEARRFRQGEAQVLVSTDAIALGLNLPIRTVCFSTLTKWNGREEVQLAPWEVLQIGGRAGRFGHHERGHVGALNRWDAQRIAQIFAPAFEAPQRALATTVRPGVDHVAVIAEALHTPRLARALTAFQRGMSFDSELLSPGVHDDMIALAEIADRFRQLPMEERLTFSVAPVDMRLEWLIDEYGTWIAERAAGGVVELAPLAPVFQKERAAHDEELMSAEMEAKRLTLYAWLAFRFPETFPDLDSCSGQRAALDRFIERSLARKAARGTAQCRSCGRPLQRRSRDGRCGRCRSRQRRSA
ncbi:MAG TPA: helicase-related protein [Longimicrobiales bacterium]|nr:helicase-related protein [Longimicrobiales bacterium]